jgi:hypothetical protein
MPRSQISDDPGSYVDRVVVGAEYQKPIEGRFIKEHAQS